MPLLFTVFTLLAIAVFLSVLFLNSCPSQEKVLLIKAKNGKFDEK